MFGITLRISFLLRDDGVTEQSIDEIPQAPFYNESAEGRITLLNCSLMLKVAR